MYMKKMVEIGKAENGYVVECRVPLKPKKEKDSERSMCGHMTAEKQYVADDINEVAKIIENIMPMLDDEFSSEDEFDKAFKDAAKDK